MVFVFYGFHLMVYLGLLMFFVGLFSLLLRLRGRLYSTRWFQRLMVAMTPAGMVAIIGGWVTAETGRQPWVVYGKLMTSSAVSPLSPGLVIASLIGFIATYVTLLTIYLAYMVRAVRQGPEEVPPIAPLPESLPGVRVPAREIF
jgi:cytochrome bd ubiquinol oxidase subunit I